MYHFSLLSGVIFKHQNLRFLELRLELYRVNSMSIWSSNLQIRLCLQISALFYRPPSSILRTLPFRASSFRIFPQSPIQWLLMHHVRAKYPPLCPCSCVYNLKVFNTCLSYQDEIRHSVLGVLLSASSPAALPTSNIPPISLFHFCSYLALPSLYFLIIFKHLLFT